MELLLFGGLLALLLGTALLGALGAEALLAVAVWLVGLGLVVGAPASLGYHLALRARLARRGLLPRRWWLHPTALHERLDDADRRAVMPWFYVGAFGFLLSVTGCVVASLAMLRIR
jgi:hypothetical protein